MSRIACCQLSPTVGDLLANQRRCIAAIRRAVDLDAELIVLPELATSGYVFASGEEALSTAVQIDEITFTAWIDEAARNGSTIVGGVCELGEEDHLYNSAVVIDGSGIHAVYRKTHLWNNERSYFKAGEEPPPVVDLPLGRIGVCICYDLEFPEVARALALDGARIVAVPTNWPLTPRPVGERAPEVAIAMATARTNGVVIACCDRVGTERGQEWTGGASIIDSSGWIVASIDHEGIALVDVDVHASSGMAGRRDPAKDRRPELYERLRRR